jgi:hypothetical protein
MTYLCSKETSKCGMKFVKGGKYDIIHKIDTQTKNETSWCNETDIISTQRVDNNLC